MDNYVGNVKVAEIDELTLDSTQDSTNAVMRDTKPNACPSFDRMGDQFPRLRKQRNVAQTEFGPTLSNDAESPGFTSLRPTKNVEVV